MNEFAGPGEELQSPEQLAFLRGVYDSADIGICVTDAERRFVMINAAYCRIYGYSHDELIGRPFTIVLPEDQRREAARTHDEFLAGAEESSGDWVVLHRDGSERIVTVTAGRVVTGDGRRFKVTTVQDVTRVRAQERRLLQLSRVVAQTQHGVIFCDADGLVTWINEGTERITEFRLAEMRGRKPGDLLQGVDTDPEVVAHMHRQIAAGEGFQVEVLNYSKSGRKHWLNIACSPVVDSTGKLEGFMALQTDITERRHFQARIEQLSFKDALTDLPNRRLLGEQLSYCLAGSARSGFYGALLYIDLDNFKVVNETLGPRQGDQLLQRVGQTLEATVHASDTIARLGGDEFVVVLTDLSESPGEAAERAELVARRILGSLEMPFGASGLEHRISASMGAVLFLGEEQSSDALLQQADIALYHAKSTGAGGFTLFDPLMQAGLLQRHRTEAELREAIHGGQLLPYYQGQIDGSGRLAGAELLIRWCHPERGLVSPGEFIPVAEACGLIVDLGYEVIRMAADQLAAWAGDAVTRELSIAVNISARHFEQADFVARVGEIVGGRGLAPGLLKFEITESALARDLDEISTRMEALRRLGVAFSLDDFGTGYSSLAYLKRLPIGQVKIDQSFVRDLLIDENDRGITETIIALAGTLRMRVVAEGVETVEQRELLARLGCPLFQGFYFDRPAPIDDFSRRYRLAP